MRGGELTGPPNPRLDAYLARTQTPLDVLALATLWLSLARPSEFDRWSTGVLVVRTALSMVYAVDLGVRSQLAHRHLRYVQHHPLAVAAVLFPAVRVLFSIRLVRSMFRRGHLPRFLVAAALLVVNGAMLVFIYERNAPGADIVTFGDSLWWSVTTVTTVGYGDYAPVTFAGRAVATGIMGVGIMAAAVITAQVAATFMAQSARRLGRERDSSPVGLGLNPDAAAAASVEERLARIEAMLLALGAPDIAADEPDG